MIESRFRGKSLIEAEDMQSGQKAIVKGAEQDSLQAQISLAQHIEAIAQNASVHADVNIKNIRNTRKREENKNHRDYMAENNGKEGEVQ